MPEDKEVKEFVFKCEGCGAVLHYSPGTTALKCEYCGREHLLEAAPKPIIEHELRELELVPHTSEQGFGVPSRHFKCNLCSAITALPGMTTATKCAFCGSSVVVETPPVTGMVMPESLVPFMITKNDAQMRFKEWLRKLWFRPGDLKKKAALAEIDGMYAPHFTFDANVFSQWSGYAGHYYYITEWYTDSQGNRRSRQVRKIRWEFRSGTHRAFYDDELVCASRGLPENILNKIYPYHLDSLVNYRPEFLSGFQAEAYTIDPRICWNTAQNSMYEKEKSACSTMLDGDTQRGLTVTSEYSKVKWKHILLPAYVAAYAYGKKVYRFMVNGQTGEVQGEAPLSWWKIGGLALVIILIIIFVAAGKALGWY